MALTPSNPFPIGSKAPIFDLYDTVSESKLSLDSLRGEKATVIMFICNHCPFVIHVNQELVALANDYTSKGVGFVAISSNDVENYPQDGPDKMKLHAQEQGYPFPYLYDESQEIAKAYDAACTPDLYVFDQELKSVYHGQLDDSRPGNGIEVTGIDIRNVLDAVLTKTTYAGKQKPSIGCNIKWKNH